ncbi:MAG TPA: [Fe-Fe] hydrogenase large subunit C-terminal domain-containing protein, partial [Syntrophales bacterium]
SDCPAVVQLVQVKFPSLLENLVPIVPPYEIMAERLKRSLPADSAPGLHYIVPCLAKARAAADPLSSEGGYSGAIPIVDLYNSLRARLHAGKEEGRGAVSAQYSSSHLEWSFSGGESRALGMDATVIVDGIHHVAGILELAENGLLTEVPFIEAWSCPGGCLGGPLNVQNPFWAKFHVLSLLRERRSTDTRNAYGANGGEASRYRLTQPFQARGGMRLDADLKVAMEKLRRIDEVVKKFPGIDCGSCGCPNCLALAEDVVQGYASEKDCIHVPKGKRRTSQKERKGFRDGNDETQG